jgi:hypothetical protein
VAVLGLGAALPSPSAPAVLQRRAVALRIRAASSSQPGRSASRAGSRASRGERLRAAAAGRHASLRLQDRLRRRPSMSEADESLARPRDVVNRRSQNVAAWMPHQIWVQGAPVRGDARDQSSVRRNPPGGLSFRFSVRRYRLGDERPPSVSQHANVGQDLLSFVFGHFALRVR